MMLERMMADGYGKMKEEAEQRQELRRLILEPANEIENQKKQKTRDAYTIDITFLRHRNTAHDDVTG